MNVLKNKILWKGPKSAESVAITFDDGPHSSNTPLLLEILAEKSAKATFFYTGKNICKHKNLAQQAHNQGHLLANHTFSHQRAIFVRKKDLYTEIRKTKELIEDITGEPNRYFRPPFGIITPALLSVCKELSLTVTLWSINSYDFLRPSSERITARIDKKICPGSIVLFHECHFKDSYKKYANTALALETLLTNLNAQKIPALTVKEFTP